MSAGESREQAPRGDAGAQAPLSKPVTAVTGRALCLLNMPDVCRKVRFSQRTIEKLIATDHTFPRAVRPTGTDRRWREDEIDNWILSLPHDGESQEPAKG